MKKICLTLILLIVFFMIRLYSDELKKRPNISLEYSINGNIDEKQNIISSCYDEMSSYSQTNELEKEVRHSESVENYIIAEKRDLSLPTRSTIFSDNFNGSYPGSWYIGHDPAGGSYSWAWPLDYAYCYADPSGSNYYYPNDLHVYMQRQNVNLSGYDTAQLSFNKIVDTEEGYDSLTVNIRDQWHQWHCIYSESGTSSSMNWEYIELNMDEFAGQTGLYIQFRFDSDGSISGSPYDGVYIENVSLDAWVVNESPVTNIYNIPSSDYLYPTKNLSFIVDYTDPNGRSDLQNIYLRLAQSNNENTNRITVMAAAGGSSAGQWNDEPDYLRNCSVSCNTITNGYRATWTINLDWNWIESNNVDIWAFCNDNSYWESGHDYENCSKDYENDIRIYSSNPNPTNGIIDPGDNFTVTGVVRFVGSNTSPDNWSGLSVKMCKNSYSGSVLDTDSSISDGYSLTWNTNSNDASFNPYYIYLVPLSSNANNQPVNSDTYYDIEEVTVLPELTITLTQPSSDIDVNQGESINISWSSNGPTSNCVALLRDLDQTWNNGNHTFITPSQQASGSYSWDTSNVPLGTSGVWTLYSTFF
ncbi:MAG: hypothetical protein K9M99_11700 [Candidatus Cloacimonetes bacterium]|nr:hypothetical protein [Candidatus Cloacimonadota bacterium]